MESWTEEYQCPECDRFHDVDFDFYRPDDGDIAYMTVECECGCRFSVECKILVEYDFETSEPTVITSRPKPIDIYDLSTWPPENDPNQLKLI